MISTASTTKTKLCAQTACGKPVKARQLCANHYNQFLRQNNRPCSVDGCSRGVIGKDLCSIHWQRHHRSGHVDRVQKRYDGEDRVAAFWGRVAIPTDRRHCWEWIPSRAYRQHGRCSINGVTEGCHVWSWMFYHGTYPTFQVLHKCDNACCVNPDHLYEGTQSQNMIDRWQRTGRRRG